MEFGECVDRCGGLSSRSRTEDHFGARDAGLRAELAAEEHVGFGPPPLRDSRMIDNTHNLNDDSLLE